MPNLQKDKGMRAAFPTYDSATGKTCNLWLAGRCRCAVWRLVQM